jgi:high affinity Mn2+ porin
MGFRFSSVSVVAVAGLTFLVAFGLGSERAAAQSMPAPAPSATPTAAPQEWSIHAQATDTQQYHGAFPAAYSGPQSLSAFPDTAKTVDATLFIGKRLWRGGEIYIDPELDQGFGLGFPGTGGMPYNGTFGVAGFLSGEAYKIGSDSSYARIQRAFIRETIDLSGAETSIDPDINQLGGSETVRHLTLTAGKFSVTDVFDNNVYAHDTKNDFINWSIIDMGAFDYAADAWGYTYGLSAELASKQSTLRAGAFQLSAEPNQIAIESVPFREWSPIIEFEERTSFFGGHPGAIKLLAYGDYGFMGSYADALAAAAATGGVPNTANVRTAEHWKTGAGLNIAQEIAAHVGVFARLSAMNGTYEAYEFTDIDRSFSTGLSIDGGLYRRPNDGFGVAGSFNAISAPAQQYFAAGGVGILIGDGALSYAGERLLETYYKVGIGQVAAVTFDYQRVADPAYNIARGPASVYGLRYHVHF